MNEYQDRPNTGRLMVSNDKKHDKSPDFWGSVKIDKDMLIDLVKNRTSNLIEIRISAWKNVSAAGNHYLGLTVSAPMQQATVEKKEEQDPWL